MLSPSGRTGRKCNFSCFVSDIDGRMSWSLEQCTPKILKKLWMRNGEPHFLSRQVMMMCYRLQENAEGEGGREGETQGWIGGRGCRSAVAKCNFPTGELNIERIKRISSTVSAPHMVWVLVKWIKESDIEHPTFFVTKNFCYKKF